MMRFIGGAASYPIAIVVSVSFHVLLLSVLLVGWGEPEPKRKVIKPKFIEARLIQIEPKAVEQPKTRPKPAPKPKPDNAAKKRAEEKARKAKEAKLKKKRAADRLKKKKLAEEKRQKDKLVKQQEATRKAEALRKQQEIARIKAEQQREQQRQEQLQQEQAMEYQLVQSYSSYIDGRVAANWSRPPSARRGMVVELQVQLAPNGQVIDVRVAKSSGSEAFDRSAEQAVRKVDRFERLRELESGVFERNFRKFRLKMTPDDLRL